MLAIVAGWAQAACIAVPTDRIVARDLWASIPLFQALDPETVIAFSPFPGTERVLSSRDIVLAARRHGLTFPAGQPAPNLCVGRVVRALSIEEVRAALRSAINDPAERLEIDLEILDFSNKPLPPGRLVFQLAALNKPPADNVQSPVIWPGKLIYDGQHSLSVWAKVRIWAPRQVFLAKQSIARGDVIRADEVASAIVPQFPWPASPPSSSSGVVGKIARHAISAGQRIALEALAGPQDVLEGDTVHVKVVDGAAIIILDGVAQSSGTQGGSILVHNPSTGKTFRAVIEDRTHVLVVFTPESTSAL